MSHERRREAARRLGAPTCGICGEIEDGDDLVRHRIVTAEVFGKLAGRAPSPPTYHNGDFWGPLCRDCHSRAHKAQAAIDEEKVRLRSEEIAREARELRAQNEGVWRGQNVASSAAYREAVADHADDLAAAVDDWCIGGGLDGSYD